MIVLTSIIEDPINRQIGLDEIKANRRRKILAELAKPEGELIVYPDGRVYRNDKLIAEPATQEQKEWVKFRMRGPPRSWERWYVGQYLTEEQKKEMGLTDEEIEGKGKVV